MKKFFRLFTFVLFLSASSSLHAYLITSQNFNYTLDMPEGFEITDMESDESAVLFKSRYLDAYAIAKVLPSPSFSSAKDALADVFSKLRASSEFSQTVWKRRTCAIASFTSPALLSEEARGWAVCVPFTTASKEGKYLSVLAYSTQANEEDLRQVLISILDSLIIDNAGFSECGIITSAFFPRNSPESITLSINGKKIETQVDADDKEANQFVIDREFAVFKFYAENDLPEMYDAWTRFYRLIARDTMERVKRASFDIYSSLWQPAKEQDGKTPERAFAQFLLTWAQDLEYGRRSADPDKADLESIPSILEGGASDCDGRSLLLMCILKNCGIDSCFFVSAEYSHALLGVYLPENAGQTIPVQNGNEKKEYLTGETTAKGITLGMMPEAMQDKSKWLSIELP